MNNDESLRRFLALHCAEHLPRRYLEIGTREGDSLRVVVETAYTLERVVCADTWGGEWGGTNRGDHRHIEALLASMLYVGDATFLDGDHSEDGARADLENVWPLCASGGCIVFHDITHPQHRYLADVWSGFLDRHRDSMRSDATILEGHGLGYCFRR